MQSDLKAIELSRPTIRKLGDSKRVEESKSEDEEEKTLEGLEPLNKMLQKIDSKSQIRRMLTLCLL